MNKLFDLGFVIGLFFLVIGLLLLGYGLTVSRQPVNYGCGMLFIVFALFMIGLSRRKRG
ncbi:hypothetical protein [Paraflavitalea pollutisoli]|uniref:hypothetical protein n=1 Tax=Paraflavitalea pollutisoli TaxID=3034143 RepID=UPI0023EC751F|nr:hypothetical protein [Paraflavitalea sp. H1-2-19X]